MGVQKYTIIIIIISLFCEFTEQCMNSNLWCHACSTCRRGNLKYGVEKDEKITNRSGLGLQTYGVPGKPRDLFVNDIFRDKYNGITNLTIQWKPPDDDSIKVLHGFEIYIADLLDGCSQVTYVVDLRNNTQSVLENHMGTEFEIRCSYQAEITNGRTLYVQIESLPESSVPKISDKTVSKQIKLFIESSTTPGEGGSPLSEIEPSADKEVIAGVVVSVVFIILIITVICFLKVKGISLLRQIKSRESCCESGDISEKSEDILMNNNQTSHSANITHETTQETLSSSSDFTHEFRYETWRQGQGYEIVNKDTQFCRNRSYTDHKSTFKANEIDRNCPVHGTIIVEPVNPNMDNDQRSVDREESYDDIMKGLEIMNFENQIN